MALTAVFGAACSTNRNVGRELTELHGQHQAERARLQEIREEIDRAKTQLIAARARAERELCRSQVARLRARTAMHRAKCMEEVADHKACLAQVAKKKSERSLAGCILGIGLAAFTAGLAAPVALTGCTLGTMSGPSESQCDAAPTCVDTPQARDRALADLSLYMTPLCGGYLGLSLVETPGETLMITEVQPGGPSETAGLQAYWRIFRVGGVAITEAEDFIDILNTIEPGQPLQLDVYDLTALQTITATTTERRPGDGL